MFKAVREYNEKKKRDPDYGTTRAYCDEDDVKRQISTSVKVALLGYDCCVDSVKVYVGLSVIEVTVSFFYAHNSSDDYYDAIQDGVENAFSYLYSHTTNTSSVDKYANKGLRYYLKGR